MYDVSKQLEDPYYLLLKNTVEKECFNNNIKLVKLYNNGLNYESLEEKDLYKTNNLTQSLTDVFTSLGEAAAKAEIPNNPNRINIFKNIFRKLSYMFLNLYLLFLKDSEPQCLAF